MHELIMETCEPVSVAAEFGGVGAAPGGTNEADTITGSDWAHAGQRLFHIKQPNWLQSRSIPLEEKAELTTICCSERTCFEGMRAPPGKEQSPALAKLSSPTD